MALKTIQVEQKNCRSLHTTEAEITLKLVTKVPYLCCHSRSSGIRITVLLATKKFKGDAARVKPVQQVLFHRVKTEHFRILFIKLG